LKFSNITEYPEIIGALDKNLSFPVEIIQNQEEIFNILKLDLFLKPF
jgi:hypothetical protein